MKEGFKVFRVALLVPIEFDVPGEFEKSAVQPDLPEKQLFVSDWFDGIAGAKELMDDAAEFYGDRKIKYLFFREIRRPA
ncbi:hypothetical protein EU537_10785 [Candidatus Thorarchaeota archaeon]|nr:MAG: hypothetical protein EU537_10785 [Candidatus Thorarchaeota archaeon]